MSAASPSEPERLEFAAEFVRHVIMALEARSLDAGERETVVAALAARTGLAPERIASLPELDFTPGFEDRVAPSELRVFTAHFGDAAAGNLRHETGEPPGLEEFADRRGAADALLLIDTLFAVAAGDGRSPPSELGQLEAAATRLGVDALLFASLVQKHVKTASMEGRRFPLERERVTVGRAASCDVVLPHPHVGALHAELFRSKSGWRVVSRDGRPTIVDHVAVTSAPLHEGSLIGIGPYQLRLAQRELYAEGTRRLTSLSVRNLKRRLGSASLLDDVSFTVFTGEVVALVGPSGCGKSTLLGAISGVAPADGGQVLLDGEDFHALLAADPSLVADVPQDDLVVPELTVEESLFYSGLLRFPPEFGDAAVRTEVTRVLAELGIEHIRGSRIGGALKRGISGGQRKRVNLGQELMTRATRVLFLDEPTSGLDPRAAHDIARLARRLADHGRIVFLVTHDLSPQILRQVDHLLVLVPGGRVAWFGPPAEANTWFGVETPDALFDRLDDRTPERWGRRYGRSPAARKYVATRQAVVGAPRGATADIPRRHHPLRILRTLVARYAKVRFRDRTGLLVLALQPLLLGLVMALVFRQPTTQLVFMLVLSSLWFGMSAAVRELIVDRVAWQRERRIGVGVGPYLASKVGVLGVATALQCVVLTGIAYVSGGLATAGYVLPALLGVSVLTGWAGMSLGLLVSASVSSSEAAIGMLVLLLIPQIAFSGILVPIDEMTPLARGLSWVTIQRYALDAAIRCGETLRYLRLGEWHERPVSGDLFLLGLRPPGEGATGLTMGTLVGVLTTFIVAQLAAVTAILWRRRG